MLCGYVALVCGWNMIWQFYIELREKCNITAPHFDIITSCSLSRWHCLLWLFMKVCQLSAWVGLCRCSWHTKKYFKKRITTWLLRVAHLGLTPLLTLTSDPRTLHDRRRTVEMEIKIMSKSWLELHSKCPALAVYEQALKAEPSNILILLNALKIRERLTHIFGMFGQSVISLYRLWSKKKKQLPTFRML